MIVQTDRGRLKFESGRLHVHHVQGRGSHAELIMDEGNVIPACTDCHRGEHP